MFVEFQLQILSNKIVVLAEKRYMTLGKDDFIQKSIPSHSHDSLAIITERGQVYALKAYEISDIEKR